ncbi:DNA mismatch repair endonuclease MutL [Psychrobacter sp. NG27]|uniref:DNA mismatch repair endonuclease MutL n=1 Tax=Psychrobacter sp. NG27 TaxID=2781966 RepID=UPI0018DF9345|nr:DNA mismatch repair endonuclease MutL [Psychrobacter sp. NG27]MBI0426326.1 ATP-binding protein [Psychrobacter sp. NG27]
MPDNHAHTRIKKLSPLLINQLAAGEVVTRPAAVVKELLENAIDAGATNIEVRITQGGMGMIEVIDDGMGIYPDDMVMAITRHATSKVADVANLHGITTLGFRGEALAAMAAVSRLTLTSSHDDSGVGRQLQVAGVLDDTPKLTPVVHGRGTTIMVKDLYFNVPARRGNLKSIATEFGHIEAIVRDVALARADVALTLFHDNKKRLSLSASTTSNSHDTVNRLPLPRLEQATGIPLTDSALEISIDLSSLIQQSIEYDNDSVIRQAAISGWLWPMHDEQTALPRLIYVNGRLVKELLISNQLRQLAQGAQLAGMGYALYFDLPTQWLNINVHPSKQRIKISPLNNVMAHLNHSIRSQLKMLNANTVKVTSSDILDTSKEDGSVSTLSDTHLSKPLAIDRSRQNQQVQAPSQSYQTASSKPFSGKSSFQQSITSGVEEILDDKSTLLNTLVLNNAPKATTSLPICLDVISSLNANTMGVVIDQNLNDKMLPWLLFYHQGQCILIAENDWYKKVGQLFESQVFGRDVLGKAQAPNSANEINQQLIMVNTQMSDQDSVVFTTDMTALLTKHAIKVIDSERLVMSMLSSTSEPFIN